ncbi:phage baseplate upper protein [Lactococcus formosensis]|uniref:phage baseplate upper protein n=1 Tax=Lactococcus formosensis TaxID=1281486 RepID=UPI002550C36A|nr:phage baseplate upper protein [Lactococcus formosensis]
MTDYNLTLSTTEANSVGVVKLRHADTNSQVLKVQVIENGLKKSFKGLTPFFCLMAREVTGQGVSEEPVTVFNAEDGTLEYTSSDNALQMIGRNEAYFSFRKQSGDTWIEQFSTRSFHYIVEKSIYSQPFKDSNYWWTFKELYDKFIKYQESGKEAWEDFVNDNKEILESIDPGGEILSELIDSRGNFERLGQRLNSMSKNIKEKKEKNSFFKKEIAFQLPLRFSSYNEIVSMSGARAIYPQSFTIDKKSSEIFVLYSPIGESDYTQRWIVVYDSDTMEEKSVFGAGNAGGEGMILKYNGGKRYLYVKSTALFIGKFDLSILPEKQEIINPLEEYKVGLLLDFTFRDGEWLIEQDGAALGEYINRKTFHWYDENFTNVTRTTFVDEEITGYWSGSYTDYIPKRQSICIGKNGFFYQQSGGMHSKGGNVVPYGYQGIKEVDRNGDLKTEYLIQPEFFIEKLEEKGFECDRIESESIFCDENGDFYTMYVHNGKTTDTITLKQGIIIFKEKSENYDSENYIDFSEGEISYNRLKRKEIENGIFPRSQDGKMRNPYTGEVIDSLKTIVEFMQNTNLKKFYFYSSAVSVVDLNNEKIENGYLVEIINVNNLVFALSYKGTGDVKNITIYTKGEELIQNEVFPAYPDNLILNLKDNVTNYFSNLPLKAQITEGKVTITGYVKIPKTRPVVISSLPVNMRPKETLSFIVALSASLSGGYGTISIFPDSGEIRCMFTSQDVDYVCLNGISFLV